MDHLEVDKQKRLAQIESERFGHMVQSLGSDTLKEMARAGPDTQVTAALHPTLARKGRGPGDLAAIGRSGWTSCRRVLESSDWLQCVLQVKMLQALGLKSTLITDGSSPINLFTTASGLLGALPGQ